MEELAVRVEKLEKRVTYLEEGLRQYRRMSALVAGILAAVIALVHLL